MTDVPSPPDVGMDAAAPADVPASPTAPAAEVSAAGADDPFAELPANEAVFARSYVEKLRNEGHRYRTEAQAAADALNDYKQVFDIYEPQDRELWLEMARRWPNDPTSVADVMAEIVSHVRGDAPPAATAGVADTDTDTGDGDEYGDLDPEHVQEMIRTALAERDEAAAQDREIAGVLNQVREAGFDPDSREGFMVLWSANNEHGGDLSAGIDAMKQWKQSIIDDYVSGRTSGARAQTSSPNGVVASQDTPIHSFDDARKATEEFLRSRNLA